MKTIQIACLLFFSTTLLLAIAPSCVTVNVNFPEAAVQQATDDYVQDLYRSKEKGRTLPTSASPATAPSTKPKTSYLQWNLISEALAEDENPLGPMKIKVNSPKALAIRDRQVARLDKLHEAKAAGQVGENNKGLLALDPGGKLKPTDRIKAQALVDAENKDRQLLYAEILTSNGYTQSRMIDLEKSFARSFQAHSSSGTWIQDDDGKWLQKP